MHLEVGDGELAETIRQRGCEAWKSREKHMIFS